MISFLFIVFSHNSLIKLNKYIAKGSLKSEEQLGKSVFFFTLWMLFIYQKLMM